MRLAVTGANGFVGQNFVQMLAHSCPFSEVRLYDRTFTQPQPFETVKVDLADNNNVHAVLAWADVIVYLAALPGGAAEKKPTLSAQINLAPLLAITAGAEGRRIVMASSIAVYGAELPPVMDDTVPARPSSVYGTHKLMAELALADAFRRKAATGVILRLPGIVVRPPAAVGFGSAFLSEIFHAIKEGRRYVLPVSQDATSWLMSAHCCARNVLHAASGHGDALSPLCMPALTVKMADLVHELGRYGDTKGINYLEQPDVQRDFGSYPPLVADRAKALGYCSDGNLTQLVESCSGTF